MEAFLKNNESFLELSKWQQRSSELIVGFTTRNGGASKNVFSSFNCGLHVYDEKTDVLNNRNKLAGLVDMPLSTWIAGEQVHDTQVMLVNRKDSGSGSASMETALKGIDGILTKETGVLLTAFFADCIPLYFFDPVDKIIGIAHAGWKGTVGGIANEMVLAFKKQGSKLENILVAIGPGISQKHYEVDMRVYNAIDGRYREKVLVPIEKNRFLLDLKKLNNEMLLQSGILRHNIDVTNFCTYEDEALFYSYRRDQGKTGRMLGFIGFRE